MKRRVVNGTESNVLNLFSRIKEIIAKNGLGDLIMPKVIGGQVKAKR